MLRRRRTNLLLAVSGSDTLMGERVEGGGEERCEEQTLTRAMSLCVNCSPVNVSDVCTDDDRPTDRR